MFICMHNADVRIIVQIWRPFLKLFSLFKQNWDLEGSIVKSFATFFLLSYLKIISVTFNLLVFTEMFVISNNSKNFIHKNALYYDASVEYSVREHLSFAILALFIGVFVGVFPLIFLVVYPAKWFQKCLNALKIQRQVIDTFVNCYQGYYKDGTNGTRDYRWFSIVYFAFQLGIFTLFMIARSIFTYTVGTIAVIVVMFLQLSLQPYKDEFKIYNITDSLLLLFVEGIFIMIIAGDEAEIKAPYFSGFSYICIAIFLLLPVIYFMTTIFWWLLVKKNLKDFCKHKLLQFRVRHVTFRQDSAEDCNHFPHRLENPADYTDQSSTPLLSGTSSSSRRLLS